MAAIPELTSRFDAPRGGGGAVVQPITRAAPRPCARPGCLAPASATLAFRYDTQQAWIAPLAPSRSPEFYDLCLTHAARTRPPRGWELVDRRPEEDRQPPVPTVPEDLGGDATVAVLAAVLRAVETPPSATASHQPSAPSADVDGRQATGAAELEDDPSPVLESPLTSPIHDHDAEADASRGAGASSAEAVSSTDRGSAAEGVSGARVRARPGRRRRRTEARASTDQRELATSW